MYKSSTAASASGGQTFYCIRTRDLYALYMYIYLYSPAVGSSSLGAIVSTGRQFSETIYTGDKEPRVNPHICNNASLPLSLTARPAILGVRTTYPQPASFQVDAGRARALCTALWPLYTALLQLNYRLCARGARLSI